MTKNKTKKGLPAELDDQNLLPDPTEIDLSINIDVVSAVAVRRGKVREMMRLGYTPHKMHETLKLGLELPNKERFYLECSVDTIKNDIKWIRQQLAAEGSGDILEKRAEVLDKLEFLYESAVTDYQDAKGQSKNSFLNTALSVMGKIVEIEGVRAPEKLTKKLGGIKNMSNLADELNKLGKNEREHLVATIGAIIERSEHRGSKGSQVPSSTS